MKFLPFTHSQIATQKSAALSLGSRSSLFLLLLLSLTVDLYFISYIKLIFCLSLVSILFCHFARCCVFFLFRFYNFSLLLLFTVAVCCCCGYFLSPFVLLSVYLNLFNFCVVVVALNSLVNYCTIRSSVDSSADFRKYWRRKNCNE